LLKILKHPPKVIITTAYREYAAEGYEFDVLDYLVKPIPFNRFMRAVGKVIQHKTSDPAPLAAQGKEEDPFIFVKEERKLIKIYLHEIICLESLRDYIKITTTSRQVTTRHTMGFFEELLPSGQFIRIHRSFMVSLTKIESVSENRIEAGGMELAIGGNYKQLIMDKLNIKSPDK
jgi:DNA-binding LytR/AlgR family response regulator